MNTATQLKIIPTATGSVGLYQLDPPWMGIKYVAVSGARTAFGRETAIFPAEEDGNVLDWEEMPGSFKGAIDHAAALEGLGYDVR